MNDLPLTSLAFAVKGLQGGLAMYIVHTPIHGVSYKTFKGMDLCFAAPAARVRHGSLLHWSDTFPQDFYHG